MDNHHLPFEYITIEDAAKAIENQENRIAMANVCGFFLCQHGSGDVSLNDKTFHIKAGDVYFYMPSTFVCVLNHSTNLNGIAVKCEIDFVLPMLEQLIDGGNILRMRENPCISLQSEQQRSLENLANLVQERQRQLSLYTPDSATFHILQRLTLTLAESLFHELLLDYACNQSLQPQVHDNRDRIFQTFLVSLFRNYKREREVSFYAAEQCLSPRYFSSVVKEKSGHSALQWIVQMVISSVRQVLTSTDLSIKEIAMEYNFPSQSFFGKYFKQYVGVSPKEYRKQARATA